jgi:internalin A
VTRATFDFSPLYNPEHLENIKTDVLRVRECKLNNLHFIKRMKPFTIKAYGNKITDLSGLEGSKLNILNVEKNFIQDITPLLSCEITQSINLAKNPIRDISPLARQSMRTLNLSMTLVKDFSPLSSIIKPFALILNGGSYFSNDETKMTSSISDLSSLKHLNVYDLSLTNNQIVDVSPLKTCKALTSLDLSQNPVSDLSSLEGMNLESIVLNQCLVRDLSFVSTLYQLKTLHIVGRYQMPLSVEGDHHLDLSPLQNLQLTSLYLVHQGINDISPLRLCKVEQDLDLSQNPIEDISPLSSYPIKNLNISHTKIKDISVLLTLPNLSKVFMLGLTLDTEAQKIIKMLPNVRIITL